MPMHSVIKESSTTTKLRVVFDSSAKSSIGISLNDTLQVGPTIYPSLTDILIRFRSFKIAVSSDISKMYRAVELSPSDRDLHRFVWRRDSSTPLSDYRMTRITFGVAASAFAAIRSLQQTAYPEQPLHIQPHKDIELKVSAIHSVEVQSNIWLEAQFSSYKKLIRITACIRRFTRNLQSKLGKSVTQNCDEFLSLEELKTAEVFLIQCSQQRSFATEIKIIKVGIPLQVSNSLLTLHPVLIGGLLRVGGHLSNAKLSAFQKHPMILHGTHRLQTVCCLQEGCCKDLSAVYGSTTFISCHTWKCFQQCWH